MAKINHAPTAPEFATAWTANLAAAVRDAATGGRIDDRGIRKIAARDDDLRLYADNVENYLTAKQQKSVGVEKLIRAGYRYALAQGERVAPDGQKMTFTRARGMNPDVVPDFFAIRGRKYDGAPIGEQVHKSLKQIAGDVTLGYFGEDSGSGCTAVFRKGPVAALDEESTLRLFGFKPEKQIGSDTFSFQRIDPKDEQFWSDFSASQFDEAFGPQLRALLGSNDVAELVAMTIEDHRPFGAPVYLLARLSDGSVAGLRGVDGGQSL